MGSGELRAYARFFFWDDREEKANDVDPFIQHLLREFLRQLGVAEENRRDRMLPAEDGKARLCHLLTEKSGVFVNSFS